MQQLQNFKVVALNHQVVRCIPVHAVLGAGAQCAGGGRERKLAGAALAMPGQPVLLFPLLDRPSQQLLQYLEVHLPLGERLGEQRLQLFDILRHDIRGMSFCVSSY
ncbi:MAG: hypothetical protein ABSF28_25895 [Terracidiphilus sp.]